MKRVGAVLHEIEISRRFRLQTRILVERAASLPIAPLAPPTTRRRAPQECRASSRPAAMARNDSALKSGSTLVKEHLRMFTSPSCPPLAVFTNQDAKPNACALVAVLTTLTELQHAVLQFVPYHRSRWGCRWNSLNRCRRSRTAILWCNNNPRSVSTLLITTIAVIPIATRPRLTLRS